MILPHRTMLYLFLWLITISSHCRGNELEPCYDSENRPQRCEPLPATFSLNQLPIVNSTCGTPPNTFCNATYSLLLGITNEKCELTCDATNPDNSHGPEMMTDFSDGVTWWQSENGIHTPQTVSIQIDLETHVQVESILINYKSFKPNGSYILRSEDNGNSFEPFNYFAFDCLNKYMIDPNLQAETQTLCQEFTNPAPGQVIFVPTLNRPSGNDSALDGFSKEFYEFSTATNIRLILDGHYMSDALNESYYYYAIEDLSIVGKCQCNGHANTCTKENNDEWICGCQHNTTGALCETCQDLYNDLEWDVAIGNKPFECKMCTCNDHADACVFNETLFDLSGGVSGGMCTNCTDNTGGPKCDQCIEFYYPDIILPVSSPDYCQECNCYSDGIVDNGACLNASTPIGQCNCKTNVEGRTCDQCKDGYFNLMSSNMHGCQDCECNDILSLSTTCNNITGVCNCKPNVSGDKCDTCEDGYFLSDSSTCSPCNCDLGGSLSTVCNISNGQCDCRSGVTGQTCRELEENKFFPFIDHYIYEAEESQGLIEFSYQLPNDPNSTNYTGSGYTGSGYARIVNDNNLINFGVFTPPISGVYEFVLRYKSVDILWDSIELRLMFNETTEDNSPPSCSEHNDPSIKYFYNNLPVAQIGAAVLPVCLRKGRNYTVVINGFVSGVQSVVTLDIDSMVILIKEPEGIMTLSDNSIQAKYSQCIMDFRNLLTRDSAKSSCEDVSFSVLTEIFNKTLDCGCDSVGVLNNTCIEYGGQCHCKTPFNIDRQCGICAAGSYIESIDNDGCAECSCSVNGSVDPFCNRFGGACSCLSNVTGDNCDMCDHGAYNLQPDVGCEQCNCHPEGSNNSQCSTNGSCICKEGVEGDKCDICNPVNFNFPICSDCNCDSVGSTMDLSCTIGGQCFCRDKTIGDKCDTCFNGHFNLHASNEEGCQPCYCSGVSTNCSSAKGFVSSQMVTLFESSNNWTISSVDTIENVPFVDGITVNANTTAYAIAPGNYLGNKLSSYRQNLSVSVDIMNEVGGYSEGYDILIASHDHRLVANFTDMLVLDEQILAIRFIEDAGWINFDTDLPVSAYELQSTLIDLLSLEIRVSLGDSVVLSSITMNTAIQDSDNSLESISWVEQCNCESPNYTGLSCEQCVDGYTRNASGQCISCECNGNADMCDKDNGVCDGCLGNTTGEHCEMCIEGYYGDPTKNIDCVQCECPFSGANGQYSLKCEISGVNDSVCTKCSTGHTGDHCEICEAGYFGDPLGVNGVSTKCTTCKCNDNINSNDSDSCDMTTGICTKCLNNTNGSECEQCLDGYYGDPIDAKNCTDCNCDTNGSINTQCDSFGDCECLDNVTGTKCTECAPLHYNFGLETGCLPCDCDQIGSMEYQCNITTGQCVCKSNVTGTKCDQCQTGYYNFSSKGCKDCGCNLESSDGSCDDKGICNCYYGVIGDKCDMCIENYYISDDNTQCNVCPSCYTEVQGAVNQTRDYYTGLLSLINALAEQNDPTTTFEEKMQFAFSQVNGLEENVTSLVSQYGQLYLDVDVLYNHTGQLNMSIASLIDLIEIAKTKVSPYAKLAQSAEQIVNNLKTEIYAGQDILAGIETTIYPNISNNTDYLNGIAVQSNVTLDDLVKYVKTLENQADEISTLVEQATDVATNSLSTANDLLVLSEDNNNLLSTVQSAVIELSSNLSVAVQELAMFNMSVIYARMSITDINASLPELPSEDYINSQINKTAQLKHITNTIMNSYDQQWMMFQSLWQSLSNIQTQYINIQQLLNQTSDTVNQYLDNFTDTLDKANEASNKANTDLLEAEGILADLKNFSSATTALKAKADLALLMATDINDTVNTIEEIVTANITQLTNVIAQLDELLMASLNLQSDSETLDKDSSTLVDESVSLSEQTTDLLNTFTANQATADQLYTDVVSSIDNVTNISTQAQPVIDTLYSNDIQSLPMNAITLTNTANTIVSNLETELADCPSIDEDYLSEVEEFVESVENIINTNDDITSVYNQLLSLYTQQETELNNLNVQIETIDARVSRLKTIITSLPLDCDSNV